MTRRQGPWRLTLARYAHPVRATRATHHSGTVAGRTFALHYPVISFPLEDVIHVEARTRGRRIFSLKMNSGVSFVLSKRDLCHRYVHAAEIGTLGKVIQNALTHGIFVLDVPFASTQQNAPQQGGKKESFH